MELSLRRWRPGHLLASWGVYWAGLLGIGLGPALIASWRATRLPDGHGTIEAGFNNGALNFTVIEEGVKTFAASTPFSTAMLWVVGPPLMLWAAWLLLRRRPNDTAAAIGGRSRPDALHAGDGPAQELVVDRADAVRVDRDRAGRL